LLNIGLDTGVLESQNFFSGFGKLGIIIMIKAKNTAMYNLGGNKIEKIF
jgi:hypothetical protein